MKYLLILILELLFIPSFAQDLSFEVSEKNPFGMKNPKSPEQLDDFKPMIGICDCKSLRRNADQTWSDTTEMVWQFKYILNGTAIQDQTWNKNGFYATSIRQYHPDSAYWVVGYNSYPVIGTKGLVWKGNKTDDEIVLNQPTVAPNGMEGINRLTFYSINENGFNWKGEFIQEDQNIVYPFWKIWCEKRVD